MKEGKLLQAVPGVVTPRTVTTASPTSQANAKIGIVDSKKHSLLKRKHFCILCLVQKINSSSEKPNAPLAHFCLTQLLEMALTLLRTQRPACD